MPKKAQVTPFLVIGLIILLFIFIFYSADLTGGGAKQEALQALSAGDVVAVKSFVDNCIKQTASDGLLLIGVQGGYTYNTPIPFYTFSADIGYGYYEGVNTLPSLQTISKELSSFVEGQLSSCTQDFKVFKEQGFSVKAQKPKAEATFAEDSTLVNLNWPLEIKKGSEKSNVQDFSASIPVRIKKIYSVVETIVAKQEENSEFIDFGYLKSTGFLVVLQPINDDVIVYAIVDNQSMLFNNPYTFMFANKFNFNDFETGIAPVLGLVPSLNATIGNEFTYSMKATGADSSKLTFSSSTDLFVIDKESGLIKFTPTKEQVGEHFAIVKVRDEKGLEDSQLVRIEVVGNA